MRVSIIIIALFVMCGLYAEDNVQEALENRLQELDKKYLRAKRKYLDDARDDYNKLKVSETKNGNLEGALEYRKKAKAIEAKIATLDAAMKKGEPVKAEETVDETSNIKELEKALGYKLSYVTRMREHKDARKCEATGHYYKCFSDKVTWKEAQEKCKKMGGYLATITSNEEYEHTLKLLQGPFAWLGASDEKQEGTWIWITGEPFKFHKWGPKNPDNYQGRQHYMHTWANGTMWGDDFAESKLGYICEWPK